MILAILHVSASTRAQKVSLSLRNVPIVAVFEQISDQTGYDFAFSTNTLKGATPITVNVKNLEMVDVLKQILANQPITYELVDKTVVIKPRDVAQSATINHVLLLNTVSGFVLDTLGKPIVGATVKLSPGKFATATGKNGVFSFIDVPSGSYTLSISSVGFKRLQMDLEVNESTKASLLSLVLKEASKVLNEIEVNTGYQRIKPEQLTGATSRMDTKEYESRISTDFLSGIANKLPGVLINDDIKFEGNSLFQIRGLSTINGGRSPLIVIDGYPTELSLNMIDPNEIKSITILKDAAAATIYGVRASNGVIIVERKQAEQGKTRVDFRTSLSLRQKDNFDRYRWDKDGASTSIDYALGLYDPNVPFSSLIAQPNGRTLNYPLPQLLRLASGAGGPLTPAQYQQQLADLRTYNNSDDYGRLFLRTAATQTYNLNFSGGNQNATYYITTNYTDNKSQQKNIDNNRLLLSGRTNLKFSKRFALEINTDVLKSQSNQAPVSDINSFYPYERFEDANGNPMATNFGSLSNPYYNQTIMAKGLLDNLYYPLAEMNEVSTKTNSLSIRVTANAIYTLENGFSLTFGGVYENSHTDLRDLASAQSARAKQIVNQYTTPGTGGNLYNYTIPPGAYLQQQGSNTNGYTGRAQLNYNKILGEDHTINAIFGGEIRRIKTEGNRAAYFGYNDQTLLQQPVNYQLIDFNQPTYVANSNLAYNNLISQQYDDNRFISGYSNVVYSFQSKYSVSGSIRIDQSNLFGTNPKYKYKPLWSVGAAWNIDRESWLENVSWLKSLKLRAAYGFNGNVAKNSLPQVIATSGINTNFPTGSLGVPMLSLRNLANRSLRWEQTQNINVGLDFSIFKNIYGNIDFYGKKSTDIMAYTQIDASKGAASALVNDASINNRGIELGLHADWLSQKNFNWNTGISFSYNKGKVLAAYNSSLTNGSLSSAYVTGANANYFVGYPVGTTFGYRLTGVNATGGQLIRSADGSTRDFVNTALDKGLADVYNAGTTIPPTNIGLSNRVDAGRFYFYCMINYYGGFIVRAPAAHPSAKRPQEGANNYWRKAGDENIPGVLPSLQWLNLYGQYFATSDIYTARGDYFTLGDLTVSYDVSKSPFLKKVGFKHFEVKVQASNVYTVALNRFNYSMATGSYYKPYVTPTYTIGLFTTL